MARSRLPDPPHTPPTETETEMGYAFVCASCGLRWSKRFQDRRSARCLPCARAWRRDDMMSRRRGLGGVAMTENPPPHPFKSSVLGREVNLNDPDGHRLLQTDLHFAAEVDAYIDRLVAKNSGVRSPLRGVLPLLPRGLKPNRSEPEPVVVVVEDETRTQIPAEAVDIVDVIVDTAMKRS